MSENAPAAPAAEDTSTFLSQEDILAAIRTDPFESKPEVPAVEGQKEKEAAPPDPAKPAESADAGPAGPKPEELAAERDFWKQQAEATKPPAKEEVKEPAKDEIPSYAFNIDDRVINALNSENPSDQKAAVQYIVAGIGQVVHQRVREEYRAALVEARKSIATEVMGQMVAVQRAQQAEQEFYSAAPDLKEYKALVGAEAAALLQQKPHLRGNPQLLFGELIPRVRTKLGLKAPEKEETNPPKILTQTQSNGTGKPSSAPFDDLLAGL